MTPGTKPRKEKNYGVFRCPEDCSGEAAFCQDFYEVHFFLSGNGHCTDVLLLRPMEPRQPICGREQRGGERIVLGMDRNLLEQLAAPGQDLTACFDAARSGCGNLLRPDGDMQQRLSFLLEQLMQEADSGEFGSEIYARGCLAQVLVLLNRQSRQERREAEAKPESDSVVYQVLHYVNAHYSEDLSLDFLANQFFISKYHLSREFNRLVGTSVYRYTIQKRLTMARQMMRQGISPTAASQQCGFGDYSNFYRAFKAQYHISPKAFIASGEASDRWDGDAPSHPGEGAHFAGNGHIP